jgi:hypothetical protein
MSATPPQAVEADDVLPTQQRDGWKTSSYCGPNGGNCVEVRHLSEAIGVRDTKALAASAPARPLAFGSEAWQAFLTDMR